MLNISQSTIKAGVDQSKYSIFQELEKRSVSPFLMRFLTTLSVLAFISLFLPWTQNIRSNGYVSTLNPYDKPQSIQSMIEGRLVQWYIQEGDIVSKGDTILRITESKEGYLDPELLQRTANQIDAKTNSAAAYIQKANNLESQYQATLKNKSVKLAQNDVYILQTKLKIRTDSIDLAAAKINLSTEIKQLSRIKELYEKGIKSLTEYEIKNLAFQEAQAKVVALENKLAANKNEVINFETNKQAIANEFDEKLAKIQADKMSSISSRYTSEGEVDKLQSQYNSYKVRSDAYYITSPIDGIITKAIAKGLGEFIKSGEDLVTIMPREFERAVEMYVRPRDMPLMKKGQKARIQFDGWPSVVFSGWPQNSYGTFGGEIFAIDNFISDNGMYRILLIEDPDEIPWPQEIRVGGGANTILLLNEVKLYYEIWRQLNGFPPDYYNKNPERNTKLKAPLRKIK